MSIITINNETCKKCGICQESCPATIIEKDLATNFPIIQSEKEQFCISCGHCETVCPESALIHTLAEGMIKPMEDGIAKIDSTDLGKYFRSRRSIRAYKSKQIDKAIFEEIMDIVRYAPTGTNRQMNQWIIISDPKLIAKLTEGTIQWMRAISVANPELAQRLNTSAIIASFEKGNDRICRNAPHIIISYAPTIHAIAVKDTVIATSHMELLFPSFGIGSCWAGYLMLAVQNSPQLKSLLGLDETATIHAALMAGYPKYEYYKTPARKGADVKWM